MARGGRRRFKVVCYLTAPEVALMNAVRGALADRTLDPVEHSGSTLLAALVRQEAQRLRHDGDLPYRHLDALTVALAGVDADPEPERRQGRPPRVPVLR